jgi:hypothetical protein
MLRRCISEQSGETLDALDRAHSRTPVAPRKKATVEMPLRLAGVEVGAVLGQLVDVTAGPSRIGASGCIK